VCLLTSLTLVHEDEYTCVHMCLLVCRFGVYGCIFAFSADVYFCILVSAFLRARASAYSYVSVRLSVS
jgi:hypothetical protein